MHMLAMFAIGRCSREPEYTMGIRCLVCQTIIGEPIEYAIERNPIYSWQCLTTERFLNIAIANWCGGCLELIENADSGSSYACPHIADGGFNF